MRVVAVIPAYNEEMMIGSVISSVRPHVNEVVVVDDGSSDATGGAAREAGAIVVRHVINRGQGAALQTGMDVACLRQAEIIIHIDSDGQHPAEHIPQLIDPIRKGEADVVLGSRFLQPGSNVPRGRLWVLKAGLLFTRLMTGLRITDPQSGFRALHVSAAKQLRLQQDRMAHASELLQLLARHKLTYREVPVVIRYTPYSMAKGQRSTAAFRILFDLIKGSFL